MTLPRVYACRKCGNQYSIEEYEEDMFCRDCGTMLMPQARVPKILKSIGNFVKKRSKEKKKSGGWLPDGYEIRKGQAQFVEEASKAIENNNVFFGNAPCGIGKSLASLLAVLPKLEENKVLEQNKLMITFRTRNQLHIFLKELKSIGRDILAVSLFGKQSMCSLRIERASESSDFHEECKKLKDNCKSLSKPFCKFYLSNIKNRMRVEEIAIDCAEEHLDPLTSMRLMSDRGYCAYEAFRKILGKAKIFLGTYHYVFDPQIRKILCGDFVIGLRNVYLIVDEAHNIPAFARELLSDQLTRVSVERALKETERFEHEICPVVRNYLGLLDDEFFQRADQNMKKQELLLLNPDKISDLFLSASGVSGSEAAATLMDYGEFVKQRQQELGHEKFLSYNYRVGEFLNNFFEKIGENYIHLARKDRRKGIILEVKCFDGREITDPILREVKGSILMSGSLSPPEIYGDLMLHENSRTHFAEFDSPFPAENRLILTARDVSSLYKKRTGKMFDKMGAYIDAISNANQGNVAVFFTSYKLMRVILEKTWTNRNQIIEQHETKRSVVVDELRKSPNNVLFGVMGGKFSEGIDYPNNLLTCVVAIGLPYASWNPYQRALIDYYDLQFPGKGETYAYLSPAILRLVQASGRVHRSPRDKGCIVILDERVTYPDIIQKLPLYFQREMKIVEGPIDCANNIREFWSLQS